MHNMNYLQMAEKFQGDCKKHGYKEALDMLRALGIRPETACCISLCFDEWGNPVNFDMQQKEYHFT